MRGRGDVGPASLSIWDVEATLETPSIVAGDDIEVTVTLANVEAALCSLLVTPQGGAALPATPAQGIEDGDVLTTAVSSSSSVQLRCISGDGQRLVDVGSVSAQPVVRDVTARLGAVGIEFSYTSLGAASCRLTGTPTPAVQGTPSTSLATMTGPPGKHDVSVVCESADDVDSAPAGGPTVFFGNATPANNAGLAPLSDVVLMSGILTIGAGPTTLAGPLTSLREVRSLVIQGAGLIFLEGLESIQRVAGNLTIAGNDNLLEIARAAPTPRGLSSLVRVEGALRIGGGNAADDNESLNQTAIPQLNTVNGGLTVSNNSVLSQMTMAARNTVNGGLTVSGNGTSPAVLDATMPNLTAVLDGDLIVAGNPELTSANFPSLQRVEGRLQITGNSSATSLGLQCLAHVDDNPAGGIRDFEISLNDAVIGCGTINAAYCGLAVEPNSFLLQNDSTFCKPSCAGVATPNCQ